MVKHWFTGRKLVSFLLLAVLVLAVGVLVSNTNPSNSNIGSQYYGTTITVGTPANASYGQADYTADGTDDDVQVQAAIDALPSSGGRIVLLAGNYNFSVTVSRAINSVTIEGVGSATTISNDAATPLFTVGSQTGWVFRDFQTDAGGLSMTGITVLDNMILGPTAYGLATPYVINGTTANFTGAVTALTYDGLSVTAGTNTFNLTRGSAIFDVATGLVVDIDGALTVESTSVLNQDLTTDASVQFAGISGTTGTFTGLITQTGTVGLYINPPTDEDTNLISVGVGGAPVMYWDESESKFRYSVGIFADAASKFGSTIAIEGGGGLTSTAGLFSGELTVNNNFYVNGTGFTALLNASDADSGPNTLRDSPTLQIRAKYWSGAASTMWNADIYHDMQTAGGTPKSQLQFSINSIDIMNLENDNGTPIVYIEGNLDMQGNDLYDINSVSIGTTSVATRVLQVTETWTAANQHNYGTYVSLVQNGANSSSVRTINIDFTKDATGTLADWRGLSINAPTYNGVVTSSYGLLVANVGHANVTNSYAYYADAQSGSSSNSWGFYSAGGNNKFVGDLEVARLGVLGSTSPAGIALYMSALPAGADAGVNAIGINMNSVGRQTSGSTNFDVIGATFTAATDGSNTGDWTNGPLGIKAIVGNISLAGSGSVSGSALFVASAPSFSNTIDINSHYGMYIYNQGNAKITNSYGMYIAAQSGSVTNNYSIYVAGSAPSYFGGELTVNATINYSHIRDYHIAATSTSTGSSGGTYTAPSASTLGGYQLDADTEKVYTEFHIESDWDEASDLSFEIEFEKNTSGGFVGDTVDIQVIFYFKGDGEATNKVQTIEVVTTVDDDAQYTSYTAMFTIDYDAGGGNDVDAGDVFGIIINLETDTSEVDDIIINNLEFSYTANIIQ